MRIVSLIGMSVIKCYKWLISPLLGCHCRFLPSCADYAHDAVCYHGIVKGGWLTLKRIVRCNPLFPAGYDPIPTKKVK